MIEFGQNFKVDTRKNRGVENSSFYFSWVQIFITIIKKIKNLFRIYYSGYKILGRSERNAT